jgi:hypothetical protein
MLLLSISAKELNHTSLFVNSKLILLINCKNDRISKKKLILDVL